MRREGYGVGGEGAGGGGCCACRIGGEGTKDRGGERGLKVGVREVTKA